MRGPTRYFPGRAPAVEGFHSDDSDDDEDTGSSGGVGEEVTKNDISNPQVPVRRRIAARIVKTGTDEAEGSHPTPRGTSSSFMPVRGIAATSGTEIPASASASAFALASESESDSSSNSADNEEGSGSVLFGSGLSGGNEMYEERKEVTQSSLRPVFMRPDLNAIEQKRLDQDRRSQSEEEQRTNIRRTEARRLLDQALLEEQRQRDAGRDREVLPDDTDFPENADADYALWKVREILRIRRDREEMRAWQNRTSIPSSVPLGNVDI